MCYKNKLKWNSTGCRKNGKLGDLIVHMTLYYVVNKWFKLWVYVRIMTINDGLYNSTTSVEWMA